MESDVQACQVFHDPGGRVQSEGAATAKDYAVNAVHPVHRPKQVGFSGSRGAAPNVYATHSPLAAKENRATGAVL